MADKKQMELSKIDALYSWLAYDLQKLKAEILNELKYSSVQVGSLYKEMKDDKEKSSSAVTQEIRYTYKQNQTIYDGITSLITDEVVSKLADLESKLAAVEQLESAIAEVHARIAEGIAMYEDNNSKAALESLAEKTEEGILEHSRQILDAIAAIPVAENFDYNRVVEEVGDRVIEILGEVVLPEPAPVPEAPVASQEPVEAKIDYDRIIYGAAEKVVESLPYPEKVDYRRIDDSFTKAASSIQANVSEDVVTAAVSAAVEKAIAALDIDAIANAVAAKIVIPEPQVPEIDYEKLSDMVAAKRAANTDQTYDVVLDETGIDQIAEKVAEKIGQSENVDYDRIATIVEERLACDEECEEPTYELMIDDEGIQAIAKCVAEEMCRTCAECELEAEEEAPVEETVEETVEEPVEEVVEEAPVEETVEQPEEGTASEEMAIALAPEYAEIDNQLVDAETGLVIRLKKSFTAKMKQSEERIKGYYSDIKNELTSYKRINSNVSWHGDRFNFGRDTIAKVNICGKTLCFYLALDPENPEFKTTVYHQKNVGNQKAYENTPFMVKIKSDAAAKKALRLVGYLAEKLGAQKETNFEAVDYVEEFAYASTKQLFDEGYIKVTKEKKVDLDF